MGYYNDHGSFITVSSFTKSSTDQTYENLDVYSLALSGKSNYTLKMKGPDSFTRYNDTIYTTE
jgi:hypothetical protein